MQHGPKSLCRSRRRLRKLRTLLGKKLRASKLRIWRNTTLPSTATQKLAKATPRMQKCIWPGKVSETGENYGAKTRRLKARNSTTTTTTHFKYHLALLNKVSSTPWAPRSNTYNLSFAMLLETQLQSSEKTRDEPPKTLGNTPTSADEVAEPATTQQRATSPPRLPSTLTSTSRPLPDSQQHPPAPAPPL